MVVARHCVRTTKTIVSQVITFSTDHIAALFDDVKDLAVNIIIPDKR